MAQFSAITFEMWNGVSWVNLSADVLANPSPKGSRGIPGNGPEDRVAAPGKLTFSLNNSQTNSAGLVGYYSPGHANAAPVWRPGLIIRLSFTYEGHTRYKWRGRIDPDGIRVIPGTKGARRVDVSCSDWIEQATYHKVNLLTSQSNKTFAEAAALLFANMPEGPLVAEYNLSETMPTVFDTNGPDTTALSELQKIATAVRHWVVLKGDSTGGETFSTVINGVPRDIPIGTDRASKLLMETGDRILMEDGSFLLLDEIESLAFTEADIEDADISYGKHIYNHITVTSYPREVDAAVSVLWSLEDATSLAAGISVTFRCPYNDPTSGNKVNGTDFTTPVSGTDFAAFANANGTGTNYTANMSVTATFGSAEAEVVVTNTHASATFWFGGPSITFQLRGKAVRVNDPARVLSKDATSITSYGPRPLNIDMKYADNPTGKDEISNAWLNTYDLKNPHYVVDRLTLIANKNSKNMFAFLFFEPREVAGITESMTAINDDFYMQGYEFEILPGGIVKWYPTFWID
jgi:hypothetical protein